MSSHHGGHEIGVGHLPCATVVATLNDLFPFDDDWRFVAIGHGPPFSRPPRARLTPAT